MAEAWVPISGPPSSIPYNNFAYRRPKRDLIVRSRSRLLLLNPVNAQSVHAETVRVHAEEKIFACLLNL
jgi:hypothetical protein